MADDLNDRIPIAKLLAYAAPAFALAVVGIPVYVYIPKFYTDVIGVNITVVGVLISTVQNTQNTRNAQTLFSNGFPKRKNHESHQIRGKGIDS